MSNNKEKKDKKPDKPKRLELGYRELEQITRSSVEDMITRGVLAEDKETQEIDFPEEIEARRKKREKDKDK